MLTRESGLWSVCVLCASLRKFCGHGGWVKVNRANENERKGATAVARREKGWPVVRAPLGY